MKTSKSGIELIKRFEGKFLTAYHGAADRPGLLTIGYGHTDAAGPPKVKKGMTISEQEATDILVSDLRSVELAVSRLVKVPLNQNQFDALVSFTFNLGESNLSRSSLLKRLNAGDYKISDEFLKWTKANGVFVQGLLNRRKAEAALWDKPLSVSGTIIKTVGAGTVIAAGTAATTSHSVWPIVIGIGGALVVSYIIYKLYRKYKDGKSLVKN